jgi:hypothetical protein
MRGRDRKSERARLVNKIVRYIQADDTELKQEKYMIRVATAQFRQRMMMFARLSGGCASCICMYVETKGARKAKTRTLGRVGPWWFAKPRGSSQGLRTGGLRRAEKPRFPTLRVTCTVIKYCVEIVWGSGILQIDEYQLV